MYVGSGLEEGPMPRLPHTLEQILLKLCDTDVPLSKEQAIARCCLTLGISEKRYDRWRNEYAGFKIDLAKRLKYLFETGRCRPRLYLISPQRSCRW